MYEMTTGGPSSKFRPAYKCDLFIEFASKFLWTLKDLSEILVQEMINFFCFYM